MWLIECCTYQTWTKPETARFCSVTKQTPNCIIFYNATILSSLLAYKEKVGDSEAVALLKQVSPVAWQHINLHGRYEFKNSPEPIDINAIIQILAQVRIPQNIPS